MSSKAVAKIWSYLGAVLALYAVGMWLLSQGGPLLPGSALLDGRSTIGCFYAIFVVGLLLGTVSLLGIQYARTSSTDCWSARIPLLGIGNVEGNDYHSFTVKLYQGLVLLLFLIIPAFSLLHFNQKVFFDLGRVWNVEAKSEGGAPVSEAIPFLWPSPAGLNVLQSSHKNQGKADFRLADRNEDIQFEQTRTSSTSEAPGWASGVSRSCREDFRGCIGISWYPYLTPISIWTVTFLAWLASGWCLTTIFLPRNHREI